jgi:hypothetical protein
MSEKIPKRGITGVRSSDFRWLPVQEEIEVGNEIIS